MFNMALSKNPAICHRGDRRGTRERNNNPLRSSASSAVNLFWLSGNSSCKHFSTLLEGLAMVRKIKPQRTQRGTENCYFSLSPPLCPLWFSETLFRKNQKVSDVLATTTQDTRDLLFCHDPLIRNKLKSLKSLNVRACAGGHT